MGVEIEAKIKVNDFAPVRERLRAVGAVPAGTAIERNVFFDQPNAALRSADKGLRLRTTRHETTGHQSHVFTFKGPRQPGLLKQREEVEARVETFESGSALLRALGYEQTLSFQKRRESWHLDDCKVELDTLPYLGTFVEVEGPCEAAVNRVLQRLDLQGSKSLHAGYVSMLMKYVEAHGIGSRDLQLDDTPRA